MDAFRLWPALAGLESAAADVEVAGADGVGVRVQTDTDRKLDAEVDAEVIVGVDDKVESKGGTPISDVGSSSICKLLSHAGDPRCVSPALA